MSQGIEFPWHRYALIAELARRLESTSPQFGKTVLQKLVYLLQSVYGVNCGYQFGIHTYGVFTAQLLQDLDYTCFLESVEMSPATSSLGGYCIKPGKNFEAIIEKGSEFLNQEEVDHALDDLVRDYGKASAVKLELLSTIVYVDRDMKIAKEPLTREKLISMVQDMKPKFAKGEISGEIDQLAEKSHIENKFNSKANTN